MCCIYNGKPIYSTTGSLDSDFAKLAKDVIEDQLTISDTTFFKKGYTFIFEICHPDDPHIVSEDIGAYLIGIQYHKTGKMLSEQCLDDYSEVGWFLS